MRPGGEEVERSARQKKTRLGLRMAGKDTVWRSRRMERSEKRATSWPCLGGCGLPAAVSPWNWA